MYLSHNSFYDKFIFAGCYDGVFINYVAIWVFYKVSRKSNCAHAFPSLMFHCMSLVNPDSRLNYKRGGLLWYRLLVNLALRVFLL